MKLPNGNHHGKSRYARADKLELYSTNLCRGFTHVHALSVDEHKHSPARMRHSKFVDYTKSRTTD